MALAVIEQVRQALVTGATLRQSEVLALCATAEHLWQQVQQAPALYGQSVFKSTEHRREYMRLYMRRYRAKARLRAITDSSASPLAG